jgi:hypothetical protein
MYVTVQYLEKTSSIFGNPVKKGSHISDIHRMAAVYKHGGIYMDSDVLILRSFDHLLTARRGHNFISPWETEGDCHAVLMGGALARLYPSEITALHPRTFLWPMYDQLDQIFGPKYYDFKENYGMHLWHSMPGTWLDDIRDPRDLLRYANTTYGRAVHQALRNSHYYRIWGLARMSL